MNMKLSSPEGRGIRPAPVAEANLDAPDHSFPDPEWRGVLELDQDHGHEVLAAKRESAAHGHNLFGNE